MDCFSELTYTILADGELAAEEARQVRNHLATCSRCRELVETLRAENRLLKEVLRELPQEAGERAGVPWFRRSWIWGDLAVVTAMLALGAAVSQWFDEQRIPAVLEWLNPFSSAGGMTLIFKLS